MSRIPRPKRYDLLSLFSGAGALDYGFELTGRFRTRACIELEPLFCQTLKSNQQRGFLSGATILNEDISKACKDTIRETYFAGKSPAGIIGGPPCETFSVRGNKKGLNDSRGMLVFVFLEWVLALKPRFFLMENVPPLARLNGGATLAALSNKTTLVRFHFWPVVRRDGKPRHGDANDQREYRKLGSFGIDGYVTR